MTIQFVVNGRTVNADELRRSAPKQKRPKAEAPAKYHRGWRVVGHPPGAMEAARAIAIAALDEWNAKSPAAQAALIRRGERPPIPWDETAWRQRTRLVPVRSKPYEIEQAAEECKAMAEKAGWLDVQIVSISKGAEA